MFVRGSADIVANDKEYLGLLLPGESKTIEYYPAVDELHNVFSRQQKVRVINKSFANRDLPDLRAAYIRDRLQQGGLKATVLEGLVTTQRSDSDRNVTLLLFVAWPSGVERSGPA